MSETLAAPASHAIEVRHSRFLARGIPVQAPEDALAALPALSTPDANHNCWAFRVGDTYRSSDDGEPAGTAGRPILAAIDGQGLDRVLVVVTRWFGGVKLGAGGLVRAYGGAAAECLRGAERVVLVAHVEPELAFGFDDTGLVHAALAAHGGERLEETFDADGVRMRLRVPADQAAALARRLRDASSDRIRWIRAGDQVDHDGREQGQ
ncbi:MAG TPA: YigZ family protein [Xanthomonadaceae bacterium]|nr:YigZ family protein [Xanthomonadaceae bacterium]